VKDGTLYRSHVKVVYSDFQQILTDNIDGMLITV